MSASFVAAVDAALTRAGFTAEERQEFRVAECKQPGDLTGREYDLLVRYEIARYEVPQDGAA